MFHEYLTFSLGLLFILLSIVIFIYPPKFGNQFYGVRTKWTLRSELMWKEGQKLFGLSILCIGFIFLVLGSFKIPGMIPDFTMFFVLVILWTLSKLIVHKMLSKKYASLNSLPDK